jgi:hypothetical protein
VFRIRQTGRAIDDGAAAVGVEGRDVAGVDDGEFKDRKVEEPELEVA